MKLKCKKCGFETFTIKGKVVVCQRCGAIYGEYENGLIIILPKEHKDVSNLPEFQN